MKVAFERVAAVVFDLGRVLIDIQPERTLEHWSTAAGVAVPTLRERFRHDRPYECFERGEIPFREYAAHLRDMLEVDLADEALEAGWNALLGGALPDADRAITTAGSRYPCFLFSNSNASHEAVWRIAHADLLAPLRDVFVSSTLGVRKPEARAYLDVAARAGFDPGAILFFDDLAENVNAARAAGYQAVRVGGPHDILEHLHQGS